MQFSHEQVDEILRVIEKATEYHDGDCLCTLCDIAAEIVEEQSLRYDPVFGDERLCSCGHVYYRHFDSWDNMAPVGCKYCPCIRFTP